MRESDTPWGSAVCCLARCGCQPFRWRCHIALPLCSRIGFNRLGWHCSAGGLGQRAKQARERGQLVSDSPFVESRPTRLLFVVVACPESREPAPPLFFHSSGALSPHILTQHFCARLTATLRRTFGAPSLTASPCSGAGAVIKASKLGAG